jgi:hypothetical protein
VRLLVNGERVPGLSLALKIEEELSIPVSYWKDRTADRETPKDAV